MATNCPPFLRREEERAKSVRRIGHQLFVMSSFIFCLFCIPLLPFHSGFCYSIVIGVNQNNIAFFDNPSTKSLCLSSSSSSSSSFNHYDDDDDYEHSLCPTRTSTSVTHQRSILPAGPSRTSSASNMLRHDLIGPGHFLFSRLSSFLDDSITESCQVPRVPSRAPT